MAVVQRRPAGRNYPPLVLAALMMLGLLAVLPSALNVPQTTPSETLEYAPVPPEDQDQPPPPAAGNFSSLGLGSSPGPGAAAAPGGNDLPPPGGEVGGRQVKAPSTKRCVGTPPRQTEDPLAPPCVGFFQGDNGGATYQGVTRDEVRIIIIVAGYSSTGNYKGANEPQPVRKYYDLAAPPKDDDHSSTRYLRAWQRYFNERYQTYGRFVHFWAYYPGPAIPEERRADAVDNYNKIKPFAVLWPLGLANIPAYTDVMASKGVLSFTGLFGLRAETFAKFPKMNWGYLPSLEEHSKSFSAYVCEKVAGQPVDFSGNVGENGRPRKYGLIYSAAAATPYVKDFVNLVTPQLRKCGVTFAAERTHPQHGVAYDGRTTGDYAPEAMAKFQQEGITTILWLFGYETNFSRAAAAINYRPEWILSGDGLSEGNWNGQDQEQSVWDHAVTFTLMTKTGPLGLSAPCRDAYITVDPEIPRGTLDMTIACFFYNGLRQLFTGIQVSGARLNPETMDKGFHAIPAIRSKDPSVPACFYVPGDYTCVKDGTILWYDSQFQDENSVNTPGCWRLTDGGQRYTPGLWPDGNATAQRKDSDPCNGNLGGRNIAA